jgi:cold shock CspA family protein
MTKAADSDLLFRALRKDQRVSFEVVNDDRREKPRADSVRVQ